MKKVGAALFFVLLACGKRGDPRPPVPLIPRATTDLVVAQRATKVVLSWGFPGLTTAGRPLPMIRRVTVFRYVEELPVAAQGRDPKTLDPGEVDLTQPQPLILFSKVPTIPAAQFAKLSTRIDSIESANLPEATEGARLIYEDSPPFRSKDGRPVRVTYAVVTEGVSARSEVSNLATIVPLDVAVPPAGLTSAAQPEGVVLTWNPPKTTATGGDAPVVTGYNVYRLPPGSLLDDFPVPINTALVKDPKYVDNPPYGTYEYRVSAVASAGPPRIESDASAAAAATFKDMLPPPPPQNVNVLVETKAVRLLWDDVEAGDLAGYFIYRVEGSHRLKLIPNPSTEAQFQDISIQQGVTYIYEITSIDKNGNESAPTRTNGVLVPKSP